MRLDGAEHRTRIKHVMAGGHDTVQVVGCDRVGFSRIDQRRSVRTMWPRFGPRVAAPTASQPGQDGRQNTTRHRHRRPWRERPLRTIAG